MSIHEKKPRQNILDRAATALEQEDSFKAELSEKEVSEVIMTALRGVNGIRVHETSVSIRKDGQASVRIRLEASSHRAMVSFELKNGDTPGTLKLFMGAFEGRVPENARAETLEFLSSRLKNPTFALEDVFRKQLQTRGISLQSAQFAFKKSNAQGKRVFSMELARVPFPVSAADSSAAAKEEAAPTEEVLKSLFRGLTPSETREKTIASLTHANGNGLSSLVPKDGSAPMSPNPEIVMPQPITVHLTKAPVETISDVRVFEGDDEDRKSAIKEREAKESRVGFFARMRTKSRELISAAAATAKRGVERMRVAKEKVAASVAHLAKRSEILAKDAAKKLGNKSAETVRSVGRWYNGLPKWVKYTASGVLIASSLSVGAGWVALPALAVKGMALSGAARGLIAAAGVFVGVEMALGASRSNKRWVRWMADRPTATAGLLAGAALIVGAGKVMHAFDHAPALFSHGHAPSSAPQVAVERAMAPVAPVLAIEQATEHAAENAVATAAAEQGSGYEEVLGHLKAQLMRLYPNLSKAPEGIKHIITTNPHQLAIETGFYDPKTGASKVFAAGMALQAHEDGHLAYVPATARDLFSTIHRGEGYERALGRLQRMLAHLYPDPSKAPAGIKEVISTKAHDLAAKAGFFDLKTGMSKVVVRGAKLFVGEDGRIAYALPNSARG